MDPNKTYLVRPDGGLVEASPFAALKPGWRLATQADWDELERRNEAQPEAPPPDDETAS